MRLISQDGMIDVPYDKCCLEVEVSRREGSVVYFIYAHTNKMTLSLARYSTEAKALKVMEMLRERNFWYKDVFKFPVDEEVEV